MIFWCGSGSWSADPCLCPMDPDPDPGSGYCYFRHRPSRCQQKTNFLLLFFCYLLFEGIYCISFSKIKSQKESQNSRNQGFSYYFLHDDWKIRIWSPDPNPDPDPYLGLVIRIRIRQAQKHVDPVNPDPDSDPDSQHCLEADSSLFQISIVMYLMSSLIMHSID